MDIPVKNEFLLKWEKYFGKAELPFVWFYSPDPGTATIANDGKGWAIWRKVSSSPKHGKL
jgi:hypothetical protein